MGVTIDRAQGGAGRDYVSYALAIEALAQGELGRRGHRRREQLARGRADRAVRDRTSRSRLWLRTAGRAANRSARSRCRRSTPDRTPPTSRPSARLDDRGYVINGRKVWVANAEAADLAIVFAATQPGMRGRGISAFLVPMDTPGVTRNSAADSLGVRGLGCMDLELRDVQRRRRLRCSARAAKGFAIAMWALDGGRVAIAAQALGVGQAALDEALAHAKPHERVRPADWQLPGDPVDARRHRDRARRGADADDEGRRRVGRGSRGRPRRTRRWPSCSRRKRRIAPPTRRCRSSPRKGYRRGSVVERLFRDVRATEIYQGTSEVQRMVIAEHILQ